MNHRDLEVGIKEKEASLQRLIAEQGRLEQPDYQKVKELEGKLAALEKDMRENPYQRRGVGLNNRPKSRSRWEASRFVRERKPRRQIGRYGRSEGEGTHGG